jgi:hypothetical protein
MKNKMNTQPQPQSKFPVIGAQTAQQHHFSNIIKTRTDRGENVNMSDLTRRDNVQFQYLNKDQIYKLVTDDQELVIKGDKGEQGDIGPTGEKGDTGNKGDMGFTGPTGFIGDIGPTGQRGLRGEMGGPTGPIGPIGLRGDRGPPGIPIRGPKGDQGDQGPPGEPGKIMLVKEFDQPITESIELDGTLSVKRLFVNNQDISLTLQQLINEIAELKDQLST